MDSFIEFLKTAAQTPLLALALLWQAIRDQLTFLVAGTLLLAFGALFGRWFYQHRAHEEAPDPAFLAWYEARMEESNIILSETQAKRLYQAYLANADVISMQQRTVVE